MTDPKNANTWAFNWSRDLQFEFQRVGLKFMFALSSDFNISDQTRSCLMYCTTVSVRWFL